jgi:hypothetical protein
MLVLSSVRASGHYSVVSPSPKPEERQQEEDDDHQADEIDDAIHDFVLCMSHVTEPRAEWQFASQ